MTANRGSDSRRHFLRALAAGTAATLAGCSGGDDPEADTETTSAPAPDARAEDVDVPEGTVTEPATGEDSPYSTIVDITEEGADPSGEEPVTALVEELAGDDTLITFPEGTYSIGRLTLSKLEQFGLRGAEDADVELVPRAPARRLGSTLLKFVDVGPFEFSGFTLDFRESGYGGRFYLLAHDDVRFRNVTVEGQYPPDVGGFRFEITDPDSTGVVENLDARHGAPDHAGSTGVWVGYAHAGEIYFQDCRIENFPDNGLYASAPGRETSRVTGDGPVHVRGGLYKNNNISNVRLGSTGSTAQGVRVVVEDVPPYGRALNARGIQLRAGGEHLIENCEIVLGADAGTGFGAIVIHSDARSATIRDTNIQVDRDGIHAINVLRPDDPQPGPSLENVSIEGTASAGEAVTIRNRSSMSLDDCEIVQSGSQRNGLLLDRVSNGTLSSTRIDVTGEPIIVRNSSITRQNVIVERNGAQENPDGE